MVRHIIKDPALLSVVSEDAGQDELDIMLDLLDTFRHHHSRCSGMAANMIGQNKRMIVVDTGLQDVVMINPVILKKSQPYLVQEKCICFDEPKKTVRYKTIRLSFYDAAFIRHRRTYTGRLAQIIEHEIDHCNGLLI
jgi:peptide deformylase